MQSTIIQALSLAIHGNAFLSHAMDAPFFPGNSCCASCKSISFVLYEPRAKGHREVPFAPTPDDWYARQAARGAVGFRVVWEPLADPGISDRMSVGFIGGGGHWRLETILTDSSELWEARWVVGKRKDPENRIWQVTYGRVAWNQPRLPARPLSLSAHEDALHALLPEIADFARTHDLNNFAVFFDRALACLKSETPLADAFHADLAPQGFLSLQAQQLLAAAEAAWVFGGMGSWNDISFKDDEQAKYESLSDQLYHRLNQAALDAANTAFSSPVP